MYQWEKLIIWLVAFTKNNGKCWRKHLLKNWHLKFAQTDLQDRKIEKKKTFRSHILSRMQHYMNLNQSKPSVRGHNYVHHDISLTAAFKRKYMTSIEKDKLE